MKVVNADPNANSDNWVQDEHRVPLICSEKLPLWRIVIAFQDSALIENSSHVSFAVGLFAHHAIMDGMSGAGFHLTFLDILNNLTSHPITWPPDTDAAAIISVPKLPLVPNLEMKDTLSVSILFALIQIFKAFVYNPVDKLNWSGPLVSAEAPLRPPISNTRSFTLPASTVSRLVAKCRAEKTSITAIVTVLAARKLAIMYPEYKRFTGSIPFSLRKFTGHSPRDMGCYTSLVESYFSYEVKPPRGYISCASSPSEILSLSDDEKLWASARATKKHIDEKTSTTHNQMVNMLKFVGDLKGFFLGQLGTKRAHAFEVTNIGVVDGGVGKEGGGAKATFDRLTFSTGLSTYAEPYCILLATAKNGLMTVAVSWETGTVGDEEAKDVLGWLEGELKRLAGA